ncbi:probable N-acetyltransferase camello isoform X1 [Pseudophryne corroboree]|uniref:probable N-acetyltransferase camello isoform X1 n=1 Tax=Pseudophryne corroboree TaxID=495146 RepID=UPI0030820832
MTDYTIRVYKNRDYNAVRMLFAEGMMEHVPATCAYILKLPRVQFVLFISFITLLLISRSYLLSLISLAVVFTAGRRLLMSEFHQYVEESQRGDLLDIEESYMASNNSCFWVAESGGRVIGMVGVQSVPRSGEVMTLRRLSVAKDRRHQGIARTLCLKVIEFAAQRGFKVVRLETSMIQTASHQLYEKLGFQKTDSKILPSLFGRFANFSIMTYEYGINDD